MKRQLLSLISTFCLILYSCDDSENDSLKVSQSLFNNINCDGTTSEVDAISSSDWTISEAAKWCNITPTKGSGNQKLTLEIEANLEETTRNVAITITPSNGGIGQAIKITQNGTTASFNPETYHYKLPVIFHMLYHDKNGKNQYVEVGGLSEVLRRVNELYRSTGADSANMNLEFVLATEDSKGKTLPEPGMERVEWNTTAIDINDFMFSNNRTYNYLIWKPSGYINIMVYKFTDVDVMGVSHSPYSPTKNPLSGTGTDSRFLTGDDLKYAYCVSINNSYIYEEPATTIPNQSDMAIMLAHELGHYLGLYHVLSEPGEDDVDTCADTDYCIDTYTYSRKAYETWVKTLVEQNGPTSFGNLTRHRDYVQNIDFTSRNIMDCTYNYLNKSTAQQKARVRRILTYSPFIPGPKKGLTSTRATYDGPLDLSIRVTK